MKKIPHFETVVGSTAWQMEQEAMAKGREEGRKEGRKDEKNTLALKLLRGGFPVGEVSALVGLPNADVEKLQEQNRQ